MNLNIKGVIVPTVTPFTAQGRLDTATLKILVNYLIERGVAGLFPAGTTGEGPLLSIAERRLMAETVVEAAAGRIPVIVHTGAITTAESLELTRHALGVGAQAAALIAPYFFHHNHDTLFRHFCTIAGQVPEFPIYLYNNPGVGNNRLSLSLVSELVDACPNIIGMKDSSGSFEMLSQLTYKLGHSFNTASGGDGQILMGVAAGIDACVSGNANVVPELVVALHRAATAGNLPLARELQYKMDMVRQILEDGQDLSLFKAGLARRGLPVGQVRPPLLQATETVVDQRWQALQALELDMAPIQV
jgi:dihydrodipicolinate synthase/N-acetylneuraminate lyase